MGVHLLDRVIGDAWPDLSTPQKVAAFEAVPYDERLRATNTYDALRIGSMHDPDAPALVLLANADPDETPVTITHRAFFRGVTQAANAFHALGVGPGDVVSFLLPLVPQAFYTLYGAEAAGISSPVNPLLEPSQLVEILRAARTKVLVALGPVPGSDIWDKVERIRGELPDLAAIVAVQAPPDAGPDVHDFDALLAAQPDDRLVSGRVIAPTDIAGYFHTGGTTGTPKLVRHTHRNQVFQAWSMILSLRCTPRRALLFGMPLFHVGGSLTQALTSLTSGGSLIVLSPAGWRNPAAAKNIWRLVERFRPEQLSSVPTVLASALHTPVGDADVSSLKRAAGGGSAIPVAVGRAYQERMKLGLHEVYGMTETSSVHTLSYLDRPVRLGAVGHATPYSRVRVVKVDAEGRFTAECGPDEIGIVTMQGPGVFGGYLNAAHNRQAFVEPGWVNSGDLGRVDADGYLWITGRAKDLVIRGGHNIDPQPVEEILYQHPAVGLAAMVGQPDAYAGELPVAYVQLKPGAQIDAGELIGWIRERTPERAAVPVQLWFIDPMPLTGVGKVFKPALRLDAARRVAESLLTDLAVGGRTFTITTHSHATQGSMISVAATGVAANERAATGEAINARLGPLTIHHEVIWQDA